MGCGGSRADAIEPRYYESWTRETESTWLTNTDSESPPEPGGAEPGSRELGAGRAGILEDGKSTQTGGTTTPATTGILSTEKRTISGAQCVNAAGAGPPRQSSFRAAEASNPTASTSLTMLLFTRQVQSVVLKDREYNVGCVWESLVFSHKGNGRTWFLAPSSERNQPSWDSVIPYCKDDLEVKDSADESSPSNSEGPSTSKTKVESRVNGTHRKCQRKKSPLMSQKPSDPMTEGRQRIVSINKGTQE